MDGVEKLEELFKKMLAQKLISVYINENDDFVLEFENDMIVELFSEDGDLSIYYEMGQDENTLH